MEQSQKYAEYLFSSQQHKLAAEEYERLIYFDGNNINFKYNLIKSYRLSGNLNSGINRIYSFYGNSLYTMPQSLATEFIKLQILTDSLSVVEKFIQQNSTLSLENKEIFQCCNLLLSGEYNEAKLYIKKAADNNITFPTTIVMLTEKAEKTKFKSPFIAASFSAIIPGTGKFYTKNWTDGIISMLFVAGNAWQAYRGFSEHGIKSGYGWTFAGLSASFYIGNIFGTVKAAKRYNKNKKNEIDNQIFEFVRSDSF
jgi:TM2 domain-containing membrane protein YozV